MRISVWVGKAGEGVRKATQQHSEREGTRCFPKRRKFPPPPPESRQQRILLKASLEILRIAASQSSDSRRARRNATPHNSRAKLNGKAKAKTERTYVRTFGAEKESEGNHPEIFSQGEGGERREAMLLLANWLEGRRCAEWGRGRKDIISFSAGWGRRWPRA